MEQFEQIRRDRDREGLSIRALAERHGVHRRAVRQALALPVPPAKRAPGRRSAPKLGEYNEIIDEWLVGDLDAPRKQVIVETAAAGATALLGCWLPDADRRGTRVHRRSRLERRSLLAGALGFVVRLPLVAFALVARHRGISHSLFACALLGAMAVALGIALPPPGILLTGGLVVGYSAHVLADGCTPHGIQLWAPVSRRRVRLLPRRARIRTGSPSEGLLAAVSGALALMPVIV